MRYLALLAVLFATGASAQPVTLAPGQAAPKSNLRLRAQPSYSARSLSSVPREYPVQLGPCERGWCEIRYLGVSGYVPENRLRFRRRTIPPPPPIATNRTPTDPETADDPGPSDRPAVPPLEPVRVRPPAVLIASGVAPDEGALASADTAPTDPPAQVVDVPTQAPTRTEPALSIEAGRAERSEPAERREPSNPEIPPERTPETRAIVPVPTPRICPDLVAQAREQYAVGALDTAVGLAAQCITEGEPLLEEAHEAYRLQARALADQGFETEAKFALLHVLAIDPAYEPIRRYQSPRYTALVNSVKQELGLPTPFRCDADLATARGHYVEGDLDSALRVVRRCLDRSDLMEPEVVEAHRIVTLASLQLSDLAAARDALVALLQRVPHYTADPVWDIPAYVSLVEMVRNQLGASAPEQ